MPLGISGQRRYTLLLFLSTAGDCCAATCVERGSDVCDTEDDRFCVDPDHTTASAWPNCSFGIELYTWHLSDAECHPELNNELCGFDGGAISVGVFGL